MLTRTQRIKKIKSQRQKNLVIVLEDIHDPHNAAAILRTCDAFGVGTVYYIFNPNSDDSIRSARKPNYNSDDSIRSTRKPNYNPRRIGKVSSASANKWLDFKIFTSTSACLKELKKKKYKIIATVLDKGATSIFKTNFRKDSSPSARNDSRIEKTALFVGNEKRGLSPEAIKSADEKIYIPMAGFVQSLNVSVTAAIFLFEITRQRQTF